MDNKIFLGMAATLVVCVCAGIGGAAGGVKAAGYGAIIGMVVCGVIASFAKNFKM